MGWKKILGDIKEKASDYAEKVKEEHEIRNKVKMDEEMRRIKNHVEELKKRKEYENAVNRLLDKFEIPDFDKFLIRVLGKKPEPTIEEDENGRQHKINPGRRDYLAYIWMHLNDEEINFQQLKDFAVKNKIIVPSFFGNETDVETEKREFTELINAIKSNFEPERISNEEHLEAQLTIFLKAKFPNRKITRQMPIIGNDILDILIDDKYAFELKVPQARADLRNLGAQLAEYQEKYPNICAIIFENNGNLSQDIADYIDKYKRDYGIRSIVLRGIKRD